jgi:DNA-binding winged helix-turn-helix (wHTH) protein
VLDTASPAEQNFVQSIHTGVDAACRVSLVPQEFCLPDKKIRFDDFELDYARFQLYRSGSAVRLEGLPLQLLMFLVDKRGQLVTREQISAELWSKDVFVDVEQGINTAIRKIRRALADDPNEPHYLQTVVGRGYRFVAPGAKEDVGDQPLAEGFAVSPEELGRAIMTAAGLDPENPRADPPKTRGNA